MAHVMINSGFLLERIIPPAHGLYEGGKLLLRKLFSLLKRMVTLRDDLSTAITGVLVGVVVQAWVHS